MLSEKEILGKIEYHKSLAEDYKKEADSLEYGSSDRNIAWTAHRSHVMAVSVLEDVLNG